jgi:hypothetical protein
VTQLRQKMPEERQRRNYSHLPQKPTSESSASCSLLSQRNGDSIRESSATSLLRRLHFDVRPLIQLTRSGVYTKRHGGFSGASFRSLRFYSRRCP